MTCCFLCVFFFLIGVCSKETIIWKYIAMFKELDLKQWLDDAPIAVSCDLCLSFFSMSTLIIFLSRQFSSVRAF